MNLVPPGRPWTGPRRASTVQAMPNHANNLRILITAELGGVPQSWAFDKHEGIPQAPSGPMEVFVDEAKAEYRNRLTTVDLVRKMVPNVPGRTDPLLSDVFGSSDGSNFHAVTRVRVYHMHNGDQQPLAGYEVSNLFDLIAIMSNIAGINRADWFPPTEEGAQGEGSLEGTSFAGGSVTEIPESELNEGARHSPD